MQFVNIVSRKVLNAKLPAGKVGDAGIDVAVGAATGVGGLRSI